MKQGSAMSAMAYNSCEKNFKYETVSLQDCKDILWCCILCL